MEILEINLGQSADLVWEYFDAQTVNIISDNPNEPVIGFVPRSGQIKVKPSIDTVYTLTATGFLGDTEVDSIQVKIKLPPYINALSSSGGVPGDSIIITGSNFNSNPSSNIVEFQGPNNIRLSANITNASDTSLTVVVPSTAISGPVQVTTDGQSSNYLSFFITNITNFIPSNNTFPTLINDHSEGGSFTFGSNIFLVGGGNPYVDIYQTSTGIMNSSIESLSLPRAGFPIAQLIGDFVYVIGGNDASNYTQRYVEQYNIISGTWKILGLNSILPTSFNGTNRCGAAVGTDIYLFTDNTTLKFDTLTKTWDTSKTPHPVSPILAKAVEYNGLIYVFGSGGNNDDQSKLVYSYDPTNDTWTQLADSPQRLLGHAVSILNNKIIVSGGQYNDTLLQFYDPVTDTWKTSTLGEVTPLPSAKFNHTSEVVNGELYLLGGNDRQILKLTPIYIP